MQARTNSFVWLLGIGSLSAILFSACNGDDDLVPAPSAEAGAGGESHGAGSAECEAIGRLCHDADTGSGTASECHTTGHQGNPAACSAIFSSCIDTCVPDEGGAAGHTGQEAAPYCRALGSLCHDADTGPGRGRDCHNIGHVGDEEACVEAFAECATFCLEAVDHEGGTGGSSGAHGHAGGQAGAHEHAGGEAGAHEHAAGGHAGAHEHAGGHAGADEHASGAAGEHAGGHGGN